MYLLPDQSGSKEGSPLKWLRIVSGMVPAEMFTYRYHGNPLDLWWHGVFVDVAPKEELQVLL